MKTTPTPWHYQEDSDAYTHIIRGPKNQFVASGPQDSSGRSEADLRFIVQCVNSERPADPAGETKDATLKLSSGLFVQYEEYAKLEAQLVASQAECEQWKTWGIIEIAVRNPNVASYIEHWEGRALKAEENADFLRRSVGACHLMISRNDLSELDGDWDATDLPPRLKKFLANRAQSAPPSQEEAKG